MRTTDKRLTPSRPTAAEPKSEVQAPSPATSTAPVIERKKNDGYHEPGALPADPLSAPSQSGQFLGGAKDVYGAQAVAPSPIAGTHAEHWDAPISIIFDTAIAQLGQSGKAEVKQALLDIMARQGDGGGWQDATVSALNHTAITSALKAGLFKDDPQMHAKLEAALATSWVNVHGGFNHGNVEGEKFLGPLPRKFLASAHPVAQAFHAASREQTLDGQPIPQKVIDAARMLNAAARADLTLDQTVRPLQISAGLLTLLAGVGHVSPQLLALAGKAVLSGFAVATPGLNFVAGLTLAHLAASFSESFFHDNALHATADTLALADKLGPMGQAIKDSHFSHTVVHHQRTFNPDYTKQFLSPEEREALRAELLAMGKQEIIDEQFGASMSTKDFFKFIGTILPAVAAVGFGLGPAALAGAAVSATAFPLMSKTIHPYLHKTEEELVNAPPFIKWFVSTGIGKHISRQHYVHHVRNGGEDVNFNLFGWFGDWVRGRYDLPTNEEMSSLRKDKVVG